MPFQPLDAPLQDPHLDIRQQHSTAIEIGLLVANGLLLLLSLSSVLYLWWSEGIGIASFVILMFIGVATVFPALFVWNWRNASIQYETDSDPKAIAQLEGSAAGFFAGFALLFWGFILLILGPTFISGFTIDGEDFNIRSILFMVIAVFLGPFQVLYIRRLNRLTKQVKAFHEV